MAMLLAPERLYFELAQRVLREAIAGQSTS
jgi:hypothetical protein